MYANTHTPKRTALGNGGLIFKPQVKVSKEKLKKRLAILLKEKKLSHQDYAVGKAASLSIDRPKKITYVSGINEGVPRCLFQLDLFDFA